MRFEVAVMRFSDFSAAGVTRPHPNPQKYLAFFRLRFLTGLQYRAAALAGVATQFAWGFMEIKVFLAFHRTNPAAFPMTLGQLSSYLWLQQAFLAFFMAWLMEGELFDCIGGGGVAYELCRPINLYDMWFARSAATRLSAGLLRCFPILIVAAFLPEPYRMHAPADPVTALLFLLTMVLGLLVTVAVCMIVYMLTFFTISPLGLRLLFSMAAEFFQGAVIPLPFFPRPIQAVMELSPFAAMQNVPLRVYSGNLAGHALLRAVALQLFWIFALVMLGKWLNALAIKKTTVQGG